MDLTNTIGTVGFDSNAQNLVAQSWSVLVDLQAQSAALAFGSTSDGKPIGTGMDANPERSAFAAPISAPELAGVPGVDSGTMARISTAMLEDACPLVVATATTPMTLAEVGVLLRSARRSPQTDSCPHPQCRAIASGALSNGLVGAINSYISMGERMLQARKEWPCDLMLEE